MAIQSIQTTELQPVTLVIALVGKQIWNMSSRVHYTQILLKSNSMVSESKRVEYDFEEPLLSQYQQRKRIMVSATR